MFYFSLNVYRWMCVCLSINAFSIIVCDERRMNHNTIQKHSNNERVSEIHLKSRRGQITFSISVVNSNKNVKLISI